MATPLGAYDTAYTPAAPLLPETLTPHTPLVTPPGPAAAPYTPVASLLDESDRPMTPVLTPPVAAAEAGDADAVG